MKEIFKIALRILINGALVYIAYLLAKWLLIPAVVVTAFLAFFNRKVGAGFHNLADYLLEVAQSIDQFGNVVCADLFDITLIKKGSIHKFGNPDETISSVLGKNKVSGTLSRTGKVVDWILDKIDPNHSIKSIEEDE